MAEWTERTLSAGREAPSSLPDCKLVRVGRLGGVSGWRLSRRALSLGLRVVGGAGCSFC